VSIRKTPAGIVDQAEPEKEGNPPPREDGDIATPKTQPPTDDDKPLEYRSNCDPLGIVADSERHVSHHRISAITEFIKRKLELPPWTPQQITP
jgi:hypothetical protein